MSTIFLIIFLNLMNFIVLQVINNFIYYQRRKGNDYYSAKIAVRTGNLGKATLVIMAP